MDFKRLGEGWVLWIRQAAWVLALFAAVQMPAQAACAARLEVVLADGARLCLSGHALGNLRPIGYLASLKNVIPTSGSYTLAIPRDLAACPAVAGLAMAGGPPVQAPAAGDSFEQRADRAVRECRLAVRAAGASTSECACAVVVVDGVSPLSSQDVAAGRGAAASPAGAAAPSVATPATATPPTAVPRAAPATAGPTPAPATAVAPGAAATAIATGPSAADIAALRQQIEALQAQMSRQSASISAAPQQAGAAPRLRARALVIGNSAYASLGALPNPRHDAEAIANKLRGFGVEVDLVLDANRNALVKALASYQTRSAGYDVNVLFYAGHGLQIGGINYLVPVDLDAAGASTGSVRLNAVSLNDVLEYLSAPTRVVFLDACRDNPLSRSLIASRSAAAVGLAPVNTTSGTLVAYATKDGSVAEDGSERHSPYTAALLQHLDAEEDIAVVLRRVRQAVLKATSSRQEPWEYGSLIGDQLVLSRLAR